MNIRHLTAAGILLAAVAAVAKAQTPQIAWQPNFEAAQAKAAAEKKPLFVVFLMDDETANDEIATTHFHEPAVVELSRSFVCVIACAGLHDAAESRDAGGAKSVCSKFGCVSCAEHQEIERLARTEFMDSPRVAAPQFLMVSPDGKTMLVRHVYLLTVPELVTKMQIALGQHDPTKFGEVLAKVRAGADELLKSANDNNAVTRKAAMSLLAASDDPRVVDFLIKQTSEDVDGQRRVEAIEAMGRCGNGKVLPVLFKILAATRSSQVREAVATTLGALRMPESAPHLLKALKSEAKPSVRRRLLGALVACDAVTPDHRKFLVGMIKDGAPADKMSALRLAPDLPAAADPAKDDLRKAALNALKESNASIRGTAYWALAKMKVVEAAPLIEKGLSAEKASDVKTLGLGAIAALTGAAYDAAECEACLSRLFTKSGIY